MMDIQGHIISASWKRKCHLDPATQSIIVTPCYSCTMAS